MRFFEGPNHGRRMSINEVQFYIRPTKGPCTVYWGCMDCDSNCPHAGNASVPHADNLGVPIVFHAPGVPMAILEQA